MIQSYLRILPAHNFFSFLHLSPTSISQIYYYRLSVRFWLHRSALVVLFLSPLSFIPPFTKQHMHELRSTRHCCIIHPLIYSGHRSIDPNGHSYNSSLSHNCFCSCLDGTLLLSSQPLSASLPPISSSSSPSGHAELQDSDSRPHLNLIDSVIVFSCAHHLYRKQCNNVLLYDWTSLSYVRFSDVFTRHCGCNKLHEKGSNSRML